MLSSGYSLILIISIFLSIYIVNYGYIYFRLWCTAFGIKNLRKNTTYKNTPSAYSLWYTYKIDKTELMNNMMGTIFIIFGILKLFDLDKFADIFSKYDMLSKNYKPYGYLYPFIEIILGISFLTKKHLKKSYIATIILMIISLIGVTNSIIQGQQLRCGCLGAFLHIPLSYVTISENMVMLIMSWILLNDKEYVNK
jgi:uncharacterized membrane protein